MFPLFGVGSYYCDKEEGYKLHCPCFSEMLCKDRPEPKPASKVLHYKPPVYQRHGSRLIPRIIHQTYFEEVTPNKHPHLSRLTNSWKQKGWDYRFDDDEDARAFISLNFSEEVLYSFDALIPGAFKADLFRLCVLLIEGGVYSDVGLLAVSKLDKAIQPDKGFMSPIDEVSNSVSFSFEDEDHCNHGINRFDYACIMGLGFLYQYACFLLILPIHVFLSSHYCYFL